MVLPSLGFFFIFTIYPLIEEFNLAIREMGRLSLNNFLYIIKDSVYIESYFRTIIFIIFDIAIKFGLGLFAAIGLKRGFKGKNFIKNVTLLPWLIPVLPSIFIWIFLYEPQYGLINYFLKTLGMINEPIPFLFKIDTAFICIIWTHAWRYTPLWTLVLLAGLYSIPEEYYEVAKIDGASSTSMFFYITLPLIKRYLFMNIILSLIWTIGEFITPWVMTRGGPADSTHIISTYAYLYYTYGNIGVSAASLVLGIPLILILVLIFVRIISKRAI